MRNKRLVGGKQIKRGKGKKRLRKNEKKTFLGGK